MYQRPMVLNMTFLKEAFLAQFCFHYIFPPLGNINHHQVNYSSFFADDTQLYISVSPNDPTALHVLIACLTDINVWMSKYLTEAKLRKKQFKKNNFIVVILSPAVLSFVVYCIYLFPPFKEKHSG